MKITTVKGAELEFNQVWLKSPVKFLDKVEQSKIHQSCIDNRLKGPVKTSKLDDALCEVYQEYFVAGAVITNDKKREYHTVIINFEEAKRLLKEEGRTCVWAMGKFWLYYNLYDDMSNNNTPSYDSIHCWTFIGAEEKEQPDLLEAEIVAIFRKYNGKDGALKSLADVKEKIEIPQRVDFFKKPETMPFELWKPQIFKEQEYINEVYRAIAYRRKIEKLELEIQRWGQHWEIIN